MGIGLGDLLRPFVANRSPTQVPWVRSAKTKVLRFNNGPSNYADWSMEVPTGSSGCLSEAAQYPNMSSYDRSTI